MSKFTEEPKAWELGQHIMEIKILIAEQSVTMKELQRDLKDHSERDIDRQSQILALKEDMDKAKGSLAVMRWAAPTAPAIIILVLKGFGLI